MKPTELDYKMFRPLHWRETNLRSPDNRNTWTGTWDGPSAESVVIARRNASATPRSPAPGQRCASAPVRSNQLNPDTAKLLAYATHSGGRHLHPERVPSATGRPTTALRLWQKTPSTIPSIHCVSPALLRLDLRKMKLGTVRAELLETMVCLQALNLANNNLIDKSFEKKWVNLDTLVELRLDENQLSSFPKVFSIKSLRRISLAKNQLQNLNGLEIMKKLQILVVDENKIRTFDREFFQNMRKLEVLYMSRNLLRIIPFNIRLAKHLRVLDLSRNDLTTLPADVLRLQNLVDLNVSGNKICRLPNWSISMVEKKRLQNIDLSQNALKRFPEYLLHMTDSLDLSGNLIKFISGDAFLTLHDMESKTLDLTGNPTQIPPTTVCECGLKSILRYFQDRKIDGKIYYGLKMFLLGSYMSGKTSLLQSVIDEQSLLEDEGERTNLLDVVKLTLTFPEEGVEEDEQVSVNLSCWDFSGNKTYQFSQMFFLQQPALIILTVNLATYTRADFYQCIGQYLEWLFSLHEGTELLIVGTKCDEAQKNDCVVVKSEIMSHVDQYLKRKFDEIEEEIRLIETRDHISAALSERLKNYRNLTQLKNQFRVHPEVIMTSSKTMQGIDTLRALIESIVNGKGRFSKVLSVVPSLWTDVDDFIVQTGNSMPFPVLEWWKFSELIVEKFGMKKAVEQIAAYLLDIGRIFFLQNDDSLTRFVVLRPIFIIELLRSLHTANASLAIADGLKKLNYHQSVIDRIKNEFVTNGMADTRIFRLLWSHMNNDNLDFVVDYLTLNVGIGYRTESKKNSKKATAEKQEKMGPEKSEKVKSTGKSEKSATPEPDATRSKRLTTFFLPWFATREMPKKIENEMQKSSNHSVAIVFSFPKFIPVGLFELFIARACRNRKWYFMEHWKDGVKGEHATDGLELFLSRISSHESQIRIKVQSKSSSGDLTELARRMWHDFLPVVRVLEKHVEQFPGAFYQRYVLCPKCGECGFVGEWSAPKDMQCLYSKECIECGHEVRTVLLVPPKEKELNRDEIGLERSLRRQKQSDLDFDESLTDIS